jgi:hypothetical protein
MRGFAEKVRTWRRDGFRLDLWDTHVPAGTGYLGHTLLAYRLTDRGRTIFQGDRFIPPLGVSIDSDECVAACLFWFTLQPGDVDEEFFEGHTTLQREWMESGRVGDQSAVVWEMKATE